MQSNVAIGVCTYKRPRLLRKCLTSLFDQVTSREFEIVVVDNDCAESGRPVVEALQETAQSRGVRLRYLVEPVQNIALARNKAVGNISSQYLAFIDDDEYADQHWLEMLCNTLERYHADVVFGPTFRICPEEFPEWLRTSSLFAIRCMDTGSRPNRTLATGNVLLRKSAVLAHPGPFDPAFGKTGGEDSQLFKLLKEEDRSLVWCNEAIVFETQEKDRRHLRWHLRRGYRGGWVTVAIKHHNYSFVRLVLYVVLWSVLGALKVGVRSLPQVNNPRGALWFFLQGMASQCGKVGYLLGVKVEEYKERKLHSDQTSIDSNRSSPPHRMQPKP